MKTKLFRKAARSNAIMGGVTRKTPCSSRFRGFNVMHTSKLLVAAAIIGLSFLGANCADAQSLNNAEQGSSRPKLVFGAPTGYAAEIATLDKVKSASTSYLNGAHNQYSLTLLGEGETLPEGASTIKIGGVTYYYTPNESSAKLNTDLKNLVSTGSAALVEGTESNHVFSVTVEDEEGEQITKYYTYDTSKLPTTAFGLTKVDNADDASTTAVRFITMVQSALSLATLLGTTAVRFITIMLQSGISQVTSSGTI
ncbi:hypothetical protein J6I39_05450 [bacterium]|nr:hypothetical protein [bacterium]